jgi:hypothetical protein
MTMSHPLDEDALFLCDCGEWHYKNEIWSLPCEQPNKKTGKIKRKRRT